MTARRSDPTGPVAIEIDHRRYQSERQHRREVLAGLRRAQRKGRQAEVAVYHDHDAACCDQEPWVRTALRIQESLRLDGVPVLWAFTDRDGIAVVPPREGES